MAVARPEMEKTNVKTIVSEMSGGGNFGETLLRSYITLLLLAMTLVDYSGQTDGALGLYSSYRGGRGGHPLNSELRNTKQVHLHTPKD